MSSTLHEVPLLDFGSSPTSPTTTTSILSTKQSLSKKKEIQSKVLQIDQIKKELLEKRYNTRVIIDDSYKIEIKKLIGQLHVLESELSKLRIQEYNEYINGLKLNELSNNNNTNNTNNSNNQLKLNNHLAIAKIDELTYKTFKYEKKQAIKRWNKALNVISAANQFSRAYENARIKKAEEILQNPITSQMKNEILELRKTLVILNNKKQLTEEQEELKAKVVEELKELDKKYHEQFTV
ncbi:predicted protein [Naegleria gruberi]|uniref:Predicted protein n=1 Tax=Naegleria gruberi TaxID=5762 RepID=D2VYP6_NAEGR|nr:uncharacterized protein NAEGRDRAFT_74195 [Naegleria gruberi]EFC38148.1 predicted protein [Naegleria gruberi]|eukprot:XP_002670892.1 predicted protein [Naegleria gruberi strain NEG-M]